jgi:hypothetical protein
MDKYDLQIWKVDVNKLNKQPHTAKKGGPKTCGFGIKLTIIHNKTYNKASELERFLGMMK